MARAETSVQLSNTTGVVLAIAPKLEDYNSANSMAQNFEAYKILRCTVKVTPQFNTVTGDPASSTVNISNNYISAPWHKAVQNTGTLSPDNVLSVKGSRSHPGLSQMTRSFVPAVESTVSLNGTSEGGDNLTNSQLLWRPLIANLEDKSRKIQHYCGLIAFHQLSTANAARRYQITTSIKVKFYGYKTTNIN